jgi:hypothetical protein
MMSLRPQFLRELTRIVGADGVVVTPEGRLTYECDMGKAPVAGAEKGRVWRK